MQNNSKQKLKIIIKRKKTLKTNKPIQYTNINKNKQINKREQKKKKRKKKRK